MLHASNKSLADAETKHRIASLMTALADAQIQYSELTMQLDKRDETIRELTDQLNIKTKLSYEQPCYWFVDGDIRDGPYCQLCWDDQGKLIRLSDLDGDEYFSVQEMQ